MINKVVNCWVTDGTLHNYIVLHVSTAPWVQQCTANFGLWLIDMIDKVDWHQKGGRNLFSRFCFFVRRSLHLLIERWNGSTVQLLDVLLKVTQYCYGEDGRLFMIYCWHLYNWCYINIKYLLSDSIYVNSLQMIIFFQLQWTCSRNINQK